MSCLIIIGPSGAGKTKVTELLFRTQPVVKPISCTTRAARPGEVNGIHYHFLSEEDFQKGVDAGDFIEHAQYAGNRYGTRYKDFEHLLHQNMDIVHVMEIQGAIQMKQSFPDAVKLVYLERPYSELVMAILERDIPNEAKRDRIVKLNEDMQVANMPCIDYHVVNETDKLDETAQKICDLLAK